MSNAAVSSRRFHFIIDAFNCNVSLLNNTKFLKDLIKEITTLLDMHIILGPESAEGIPDNPGLSVFAIIDFSHISIHTFTNSGEFCLDIFSCKYFNYKELEKLIAEKFNLTREQYNKSIVRYDQFEIERCNNDFSPTQYLKDYYTHLGSESKQVLDWYNKIYDSIQPQSTLLEIGGGPTIYQLIAAVKKINKIHFTDIDQRNIDIIKQWISNNDCFWDQWFNYSIFGNKKIKNDILLATKSEVSKKIIDLSILDIANSNNQSTNLFDIVQSTYCPESATDDISEYKRMLKNISSYLKPGGILIMAALEGAIVYKIGNKHLPAIYLDEDLINEYLTDAGFKIESIQKIVSDNSNKSKYHGFLMVKAIKN